jgi:Tol biopolymer transport system component
MLTAGTSPSFSPDGTSLAVGGPQTSLNRYELDIINLEGGGRHSIATDAAPHPHPSWSPDGTQIAFVSFTREQMDFPSIKRVRTDGSGENGVRAFGEDPTWSPTGNWIAYTDNGDRSLPTSVHVVRPSGSGDRTIAKLSGRDAAAATWTPKAGRLVFTTFPAGHEGTDNQYGGVLWTVEANGHAAQPLPPCRHKTDRR